MEQSTPSHQQTINATKFAPEPIPSYVTKDALLGEIVELYPEAISVIQEYGLHCVGCFASGFDTVEVGCKVHGFDDAIIDEMIRRVNEVIHEVRRLGTPAPNQ